VVRLRNEGNQLPDHRVRRGGTLRVAQHDAVHVEALSLTQTLVGGEEKHPVAKDRSATGAAELVAIERVRIGRIEFEEVARIERVVAEELVTLAVEIVGARSRDEI